MQEKLLLLSLYQTTEFLPYQSHFDQSPCGKDISVMFPIQQKTNHATIQNGQCFLRLNLYEEVCWHQYRIQNDQNIHSEKKEKQIDAHKLARFVNVAVPFDGGECRPGILISLDRHICSCYGLHIAHELNLLVPLLVTVF